MKADLIALTEIWLSSKISNTELFHCEKRYVVYRSDRSDRVGGGALLAVDERFDCYCIPIISNIESVWCCLNVYFKNVIVGVCYRSPSSDASFCDSLHDCLNQVMVRYLNA